LQYGLADLLLERGVPVECGLIIWQAERSGYLASGGVLAGTCGDDEAKQLAVACGALRYGFAGIFIFDKNELTEESLAAARSQLGRATMAMVERY
jgi:hypothetical protein